MKKLFCFTFLTFLQALFGQNPIEEILQEEFEKGRFNGSVLWSDNGEVFQFHKGFSNIQFEVEINDETRFPIASISKLFTSIAILQMMEKGKLDFNHSIDKYIADLPENSKNIQIQDLLIHHSGLANEPLKAVSEKFSLDEYIQNFVNKSEEEVVFNYNNVDFVLLSKLIENSTGKKFSMALEDIIFRPLNLNDTGFVDESEVIKNLAYGYHNYSFGEGEKDDSLFNDSRYISNYYGAGAIYSTLQDLHKFLFALKNNDLISEETKHQFLLKPQTDEFIDWLSGIPTIGFYYDEPKSVYRRSGSIDGFNSEIITNADFDKILIILCNTDTADLENLANKIYFKK